MNVAVSVGFAMAAIMAACLYVLWYGSAVIIDQLEGRIETLERQWGDTFAPVVADDEPATDEFPAVQPDTEPMPLIVDPTPAVQARRDAAWDQQRPSPVPRDDEPWKARNAEWVESELARFNFDGGRK